MDGSLKTEKLRIPSVWCDQLDKLAITDIKFLQLKTASVAVS